MTGNPLPCIICGRSLEHCWKEKEENGFTTNQPDGGTAFSTSGHYGSGVFDNVEPGTTVLEIAICDTCLEEKWPRTREIKDATRPIFVVARDTTHTPDATA